MAKFKRIYTTKEAFAKVGELNLGRQKTNQMLYYLMPRNGMCRKNFEHYEYCADSVDEFVAEYKNGIPAGWISYSDVMDKFSISRPKLQKIIDANSIPLKKFYRERFFMEEKEIAKYLKQESKNDK